MVKKLIQIMKEKGYVVFEKGFYNLNVVCVRGEFKPDEFNCKMYIFYKTPESNGEWVLHIFPITTYPGLHWIDNPMRPEGCAVIKEGQYKSCWCVGYHYHIKALVQGEKTGGLSWHRIQPKERINYPEINKRPFFSGWVGLNYHPVMDYNHDTVGQDSAGCVVAKLDHDFNMTMSLVEKQVKSGMGTKVTMTLLNEGELINYGSV